VGWSELNSTFLYLLVARLDYLVLGWAELGWTGLIWTGLDWAGLGWTELDWRFLIISSSRNALIILIILGILDKMKFSD